MSDPDAPMPAPRRVLLAEDDPVSASFLGEALGQLGFAVHACDEGQAALRLARHQRFDLLLLDCHLPGMGARGILRALLADADAASRHAPVLATSAEVPPGLRRELEALGCVAVLHKPLRMDELEQAVGHCAVVDPARLVDDAAGLAASGSPDNLHALRSLFAGELATLAGDLPALRDDPPGLRERLHRLRSSCGFCGALALGAACADLAGALEADARTRAQAWTRFEGMLADTLRQLRASGTAAPR